MVGRHEEVLPERLLVGATYCCLEDDEMLFRQNQPAEHFYLVLSGRMDTLRMSNDGEEHIIQHVSAWQLLAPIVTFMSDGLYPVSCRAAKATQLCQMSRSSLHEACSAHPQLAMQMLEFAGRALSSRIDEADNLVGRNTPERLAGYLLSLPQEPDEAFQLPLSQRQLATKFGVRAETISRLLSDWHRQGGIAGQRRYWKILDHEALRGLSGS
ncbi:Crp/Fnr family transcriptional regulator [Pseudomonas moorei]|uniref:Crp/Fnr family transcriptional regulator n=1 Tax=Pseudomonas moorei TaxID=395599 RepID=UPI001FF3A67A|nr:Crp/Fnr family transcriptional regulator [Pseudomonas moorei]